MKIVIDARLYGLHHRGIGRYLMQLVNGLINSQSPHDYVLLIDPAAQDKLPKLPRNITSQEAPYRIYSLAEQIYLPRLIKKISPALVHWTHVSAPFFCPAPFVVTIHDLIIHHAPAERASRLPGLVYWFKVLAYRVLTRHLVHQAKKIITVSQAVGADIAHYYPQARTKIEAIHLAPTSWPPAEYRPINKPFILMVGAAYPHKNLENGLRAAAIMRQKYPDLELRLVGRSDFFAKKLVAWAEAQGYKDWFIFMGQVSDAELVGLYEKCQAYFLPSLQEGYGLGAVEAAAAGAAVVAADIPVLREVMAGGALYAEPQDVSGLAQALIKVMDPEIKAALKQAAARVVAKYSWVETVRKTQAVYDKSIE